MSVRPEFAQNLVCQTKSLAFSAMSEPEPVGGGRHVREERMVCGDGGSGRRWETVGVKSKRCCVGMRAEASQVGWVVGKTPGVGSPTGRGVATNCQVHGG